MIRPTGVASLYHLHPAWARIALGCLLVAVDACAPVDEKPPATGGEGASVVEAAPVADAAELPIFTETIPESDVPALGREMALTLVAMPLSCLDRPHAPPRDRRTYLDTLVATRVPGYEDDRAFYGCWDWHSAVNSTWAMVKIYKEFPDIPVSGLIDEKLDDHLSEEALQGELAFFEDSRSFERPYGWAWLLRLHAELGDWDHPDALTWAGHVAPLATVFSERMVEWLEDLKIPSRSGAHSNTAFALAMMLDAARETGDLRLEQSVDGAARRFFGDDYGCPTAYEPWGSDFLSPCLEEAALMAAVLDADGFRAWLDEFLPPLTSREFRPLTSPTDPDDVVAEMESVQDTTSSSPSGSAEEGATSVADRREAAERRFLASASHLIGLAFIRADAVNRIVAALPEDDPRIPALRRIARLHGSKGFEAMFDADYAGSHWIGTFALKYLLTERDRAAAEATTEPEG